MCHLIIRFDKNCGGRGGGGTKKQTKQAKNNNNNIEELLTRKTIQFAWVLLLCRSTMIRPTVWL